MNKVIILAAGSSQRFGRDKLFEPINGKPLLFYSIRAFQEHPAISAIIIVAGAHNLEQITTLISRENFPKVTSTLLGGETRFQSLQNGFAALENCEKVLVHNGANPLVSAAEISALIEALDTYEGALVGHYTTSTIKEIDEKTVRKTLDRRQIFAAQTPQAAHFTTLQKALNAAQNGEITDESMLLEQIGAKIAHLPAAPENIKVTTEADLTIISAFLGAPPAGFLVGTGQDSHRFRDENGLTLGGHNFPELKAFEADSDGDVILHSIFNAISQALGEGSLGLTATPLCRAGEKDSRQYLAIILKKMHARGYKLHNLGLMLEGAYPKIEPLVPTIKASLSALLRLDARRIGLTATSGDGLTPFGKGEGLQCIATISLIKHA